MHNALYEKGMENFIYALFTYMYMLTYMPNIHRCHCVQVTICVARILVLDRSRNKCSSHTSAAANQTSQFQMVSLT